MRVAYRDHGTPFPGIPEKDHSTISAYRGTVVVAVGGNQTPFEKRFAETLYAKRTGRSLPISLRRSGNELVSVKSLSRTYGISFEEVRVAQMVASRSQADVRDVCARMRFAADGKRIARAAELQREENQRALLSDLSANATEQLKIQLDVKCGLRPSDEEIARRPYGFTTKMPWEKK
jgi:hypothetical protein